VVGVGVSIHPTQFRDGVSDPLLLKFARLGRGLGAEAWLFPFTCIFCYLLVYHVHHCFKYCFRCGGQAFKWYQRAAAQGAAQAFFNLAICYETGTGTAKDVRKAAQSYLLASKGEGDTAGDSGRFRTTRFVARLRTSPLRRSSAHARTPPLRSSARPYFTLCRFFGGVLVALRVVVLGGACHKSMLCV
jgi:hypothetical protein